VAHTVGIEAPDDWVIERVDLEQVARQIQVALLVLHPRDRALFLAHYWEGLSFRQVAERYGMAHGAVRSVFWRSHRKLRAALEPVMPDLVTPDLAVATA
jgi:RNA polymerase sigma factor (sigma-70 family)